jgi:hypothetical protein
MKPKPLPSFDLVRSIFDYHPLTGALTWKDRTQDQFPTDGKHKALNQQFTGKEAGHVSGSTGYRMVSVNNQDYLVHRLIWLWVTGVEPNKVDHINQNKADNRWNNLRSVTNSQNVCNSPKRLDNKSGFRGVCEARSHGTNRKWTAQIKAEGRQIHLGTYNTPEEANEAYLKASKQYHGEFAYQGPDEYTLPALNPNRVVQACRGVRLIKGKSACKFLAHIKINRKQYHLGMFDTLEQAAHKYGEARANRHDWDAYWSGGEAA